MDDRLLAGPQLNEGRVRIDSTWRGWPPSPERKQYEATDDGEQPKSVEYEDHACLILDEHAGLALKCEWRLARRLDFERRH